MYCQWRWHLGTSPVSRSAEYIFISLWDYQAHCAISENAVILMYTARGRKQYCKLLYCYRRVSIKPRLPFSVCNVFFVSKGNLFYFNFTVLNLKQKLNQSSGNDMAPNLPKRLSCFHLLAGLCWLLFWIHRGIILAHFMSQVALWLVDTIQKKFWKKRKNNQWKIWYSCVPG